MKYSNVHAHRVLKSSFWVKAFVFVFLLAVVPVVFLSVAALNSFDALYVQVLDLEKKSSQKIAGLARLKNTLSSLYENMQLEHFIIIAACVCVASFLLYSFILKLKGYMLVFAGAFSSIEKAQYDYRLPVYRRDDCEFLVAHFNAMMDRLERSQRILTKLFLLDFPGDQEQDLHSKSLEIIQGRVRDGDLSCMVHEQLHEVFFMVLDLSREEQNLRERLLFYCKRFVREHYLGKTQCHLEKLCTDLDKYLHDLSEEDPLDIPASFGIIDTNKMILRYVNCGFKGMVLFKSHSIELLSSQESCLGIAGEAYQQCELHLRSGDLLFFSLYPLSIESQADLYTLRFDSLKKEVSSKYLNDIILELIDFVQNSELCVGSLMLKVLDRYAQSSDDAFSAHLSEEAQDLYASEVLEAPDDVGDHDAFDDSATSAFPKNSQSLAKESPLNRESQDNIRYMRRYLDHLSSRPRKNPQD